MNLTISETTLRHVQDFLANVRVFDMKEANMGELPFVDNTFKSLSNCMTLHDEDGRVFAIGGVEPDITCGRIYGLVWMLCTTRVEEHPIAFLRYMKRVLVFTFKTSPYTRLSNQVWLGNTLHVKWLKYMGAHMLDKTANGQLQYFEFRKEDYM